MCTPAVLNNLSAEPPIHLIIEFANPLLIALFIIASVATYADIDPLVFGGCLAAFSIPTIVTSVVIAVRARLSSSKAVFVAMAVLSLMTAAIGALTITGFISPFTAGWIITGPGVVLGSTSALLSCCWPCMAVASVA